MIVGHNNIAQAVVCEFSMVLYRRRSNLCSPTVSFLKCGFSWHILLTLFVFGFFERCARSSPFLQLRRRYKACRSSDVIFSSLPPVMIIFANYLRTNQTIQFVSWQTTYTVQLSNTKEKEKAQRNERSIWYTAEQNGMGFLIAI